MSTQNTQNENQEIDLGQIFNKIGGLFDIFGDTIFGMMLFVKNHIFVLIVLLISGIGIGYFLDVNFDSYDQKIIVKPNFETVDYLYNKVSLINSRIAQNDTVFLKNIGIENPNKLKSIKIKPIVDIYDFVNQRTVTINNAQNTQNYELVKLLAESSDITKVINDTITSKNYENHIITIKTDGLITEKNTIDPILTYLNDSQYYSSIQKVFIENIKNKIQKDEQTISQIDTMLNSFSKKRNFNINDKLVYFNENTQLNDIINTKTNLVQSLGYQKTQLEEMSKIIKDISEVLNVKSTKGISNKMKLVLPILFISGFLFLGFIRNFYKKHEEKFSKS